MADISATLIKDLREKTGAGVMDCRKALQECSGDMGKAETWLRQHGMEKADKLAGREAAEGLVDAYIHPGGRIGVLIEVNCGTDFVARGPDFQNLVHELALQVAAANPVAVDVDGVDQAWIEKEREEYRAQPDVAGKPADIQDKIIVGRLQKKLQEVVLMKQPYVKDPGKTIEELVKETSGKLGEPVRVRRFARFELGR